MLRMHASHTIWQRRFRAATTIISASIATGIIALGCAAAAEQKFTDQFEKEVGQTTLDDYLLQFGPPHSKSSLTTGGVVCAWRFSRGVVLRWPLPKHVETYDEIRLSFDKDGVLQDFYVVCER